MTESETKATAQALAALADGMDRLREEAQDAVPAADRDRLERAVNQVRRAEQAVRSSSATARQWPRPGSMAYRGLVAAAASGVRVFRVADLAELMDAHFGKSPNVRSLTTALCRGVRRGLLRREPSPGLYRVEPDAWERFVALAMSEHE